MSKKSRNKYRNPVLATESCREVRNVAIDDMELRVDGDDVKQEYVDGIGVVYDKETEIWDGYFEKIRSGAFSKCLNKNSEIKSFFNHDPNMVLSTTRSNPRLVLEDTERGLIFRSPIPDTSYGRDLVENLRRKNVRGASFSFSVPEDGAIWTRDDNGNYHREITEAVIYEVGPVTNPAYPQTKVNVRSKDDLMAEAREALEDAEMETDITAETKIRDTIQRNQNFLTLKQLQLTLLKRSVP